MLPTAIVEKFDQWDELEDKLRAAIAELRTQQIGAGAMATALLKQVFVALLRRSLRSPETWNERFAMLSEPRVGRAFAEMVVQPGAPHSVEALAKTAGLSRSAFMEHFTAAFGSSPNSRSSSDPHAPRSDDAHKRQLIPRAIDGENDADQGKRSVGKRLRK